MATTTAANLDAANELRAHHACQQPQDRGIRSAALAEDATTGRYTGHVTVEPDEILWALNGWDADPVRASRTRGGEGRRRRPPAFA